MLDEGDRAIIKEISYEAAEHMVQRVQGSFDVRLNLHKAECPTAKGFEAAKNKAYGVWITIGLLASVVIYLISVVLQMTGQGH